MGLSEPTTAITDYGLAFVSVFLGLILLRHSGRTSLLWGIGFLSAAGAAAGGRTFHGFAPYFDEANHRAIWNLTIVLIGASGGFMISAALSGPLKRDGPNTRWLKAGLLLTIGGLGVQQSGFSLHPHFNHNDIYHCLQAVALYLFFRGAQLSG
jgi:hypothetical protein